MVLQTTFVAVRQDPAARTMACYESRLVVLSCTTIARSCARQRYRHYLRSDRASAEDGRDALGMAFYSAFSDRGVFGCTVYQSGILLTPLTVPPSEVRAERNRNRIRTQTQQSGKYRAHYQPQRQRK